MSISVQLYTVRDAIADDLPGTMRRLAEIGFTQVEPYNFVALADDLARAFADTGLTAPTAHAPLLSSDQDAIFEAARQLGIATVIEPFVPAEHWQDEASIREIATALNAAAKKAAAYGITVGYHNHWWELESRVGGTSALEYFASLLDPDLVLEVDTYWAQVGGEDPVALLTRLGSQVVAIHVKDGPGRVGVEPVDPTGEVVMGQVPAGQGVMDVPAVVAAPPALRYAVIEFDAYVGDLFAALADSLAYVSANTEAGAR